MAKTFVPWSEKMMGHHYGGSVWESEKGLKKNAAFMDA